MEREGEGNTICNWCATIQKGLVKGLDELESRGGGAETIQTIVQIGQNTQKSPGDLKRLAVT